MLFLLLFLYLLLIQTSIDTIVSVESLHEEDEKHYKSRRNNVDLLNSINTVKDNLFLPESFGTLDTLVCISYVLCVMCYVLCVIEDNMR
jgi:hypothetical protein